MDTTQAFTALPAWAMPDAPHGTAIFEVAALADVEGKWMRLNAATQRALMGFPVFGRQPISVNADGTITVSRSVCFGTMRESATYPADVVRAAAAARKRLSPGVFGPAYFYS